MQISSVPGIEQPVSYLASVLRYRDFWMHLAHHELKNRFRRTYLGIVWFIIQPWLLSLIIAFVLHFLFDQPFWEFSVYVFSGIILWEWVLQSILIGSGSIINAEPYIRQKKLPLVIYPLKTSIALAYSFLLAMTGLIAWIFVTIPHVVSLYWVMVIPSIAIIAIALSANLVWSSILGILFRDFPQTAQLLLQILWFVSPVFMARSLFENPGLKHWDYINPASNMLDLLRKPLMYKQVPDIEDYMFVIIFAVFNYALAYYFLRRYENSIIYYL